MAKESSPWRVLAVEEEITSDKSKILSYDMISKYISQVDHICVANWYCRMQAALRDDPCDKPMETCMAFGKMAAYSASRGISRLISKADALKILEEAEKAGLVHVTTNTSDKLHFICNCCGCHCLVLQSSKLTSPCSNAITSGFLSKLDEEKCTECGECIERCPMEALTMEDDYSDHGWRSLHRMRVVHFRLSHIRLEPGAHGSATGSSVWKPCFHGDVHRAGTTVLLRKGEHTSFKSMPMNYAFGRGIDTASMHKRRPIHPRTIFTADCRKTPGL